MYIKIIVMTIPQGYLPVMPYLVIKNAYGFIDAMKEVFNAEIQYLEERKESEIKHAELRIEEAVIMFSEATEDYPPFPASMFLYISDAKTALEKAAAKGLKIILEYSEKPYGNGGGFNNGFGNVWWVNTPV